MTLQAFVEIYPGMVIILGIQPTILPQCTPLNRIHQAAYTATSVGVMERMSIEKNITTACGMKENVTGSVSAKSETTSVAVNLGVVGM